MRCMCGPGRNTSIAVLCWDSILVAVRLLELFYYQAFGLRFRQIATFICRVIGNCAIGTCIAHECQSVY